MQDNELPGSLPQTNIDSALAAASTASKKQDSMKNFSVRLPEELKAQAQFICERNATDLGTFLRECTKALVRDYGVKTPEEA